MSFDIFMNDVCPKVPQALKARRDQATSNSR
jgi:hypothetical protein